MVSFPQSPPDARFVHARNLSHFVSFVPFCKPIQNAARSSSLAFDFPANTAMLVFTIAPMLLQALKFIFICIEVILIFNLMIVVHELGHFLAARWRGLVVEKFAIWFGKPIWKKTIGGVEYRLGSIPAGGFVAIPQLAPMEMLEGDVETDRAKLPPVKPIDKIIVAFAGPLFSFGLAVLFACIVWIVGRPVGEAELTTVIGYVKPGDPAAQAGLRPGDRILDINGQPVTRFGGMGNVRESISWNILRSNAPVIPIRIERNGQPLTIDVHPVTPEREGWGRKFLPEIGIEPKITPVVAQPIADSPAAAAGIKPGDRILATDGRAILHPVDLSKALEQNTGQPVTLTIQRDNQTFDITVTPRAPEGLDRPLLGIRWDLRGRVGLAHPSPASQIVASVTTIWETLAALLSPRSEIGAQHLAGPVGIMRVYYLLFQSENGWLLALWFSVVLNVNLALLNLLPIPVLDGGHITLAIVEGIARRPINVRLLEFLQSACALLLIGFILYVTFFDVLDLDPNGAKRKGEGGGPPEEIRFSPPARPSPSL
jgi:regulator of sigma E protease